jgi:hypothetical protein
MKLRYILSVLLLSGAFFFLSTRKPAMAVTPPPAGTVPLSQNHLDGGFIRHGNQGFQVICRVAVTTMMIQINQLVNIM